MILFYRFCNNEFLIIEYDVTIVTIVELLKVCQSGKY